MKRIITIIAKTTTIALTAVTLLTAVAAAPSPTKTNTTNNVVYLTTSDFDNNMQQSYYTLTHRKGNYLVIEISDGTVINAKTGAGKLDTTDKTYNYISYKGVKGIRNGSRVRTYAVYNPNNNYEDDIATRFDKVIKY